MTKFLTVVSLFLTLIVHGQKKPLIDKDQERLNKVCDTFMLFFTNGQFKAALDLLKQNSVIEPEKIDTILAKIENHAQNVFPFYGKMLTPELIGQRKVMDFIIKRYYILKFEKYPLKFDFTLYKSSKGWVITSFTYNEELIEVLE